MKTNQKAQGNRESCKAVEESVEQRKKFRAARRSRRGY